MTKAFRYVAANKGIDSEAAYPYVGEVRNLQFHTFQNKYHIKSWTKNETSFLTSPSFETSMEWYTFGMGHIMIWTIAPPSAWYDR